jgi:hypothetical protein
MLHWFTTVLLLLLFFAPLVFRTRQIISVCSNLKNAPEFYAQPGAICKLLQKFYAPTIAATCQPSLAGTIAST